MSKLTGRMVEAAAQLKAMGALRVRLRRPAESPRGLPCKSAMLTINTDIDRPANVGGGKVGFLVYAEHNHEHDLLNTLMRVVCEIIEDAGLYGAALTNAIEDKRRAEARAATAEARAAGILDGKSGNVAFGDVLVREGSGGVWLLDPVKQNAGFGLWFESLDALWRAHPNLRPVSWASGDLICRPFRLACSDGGDEQ